MGASSYTSPLANISRNQEMLRMREVEPPHYLCVGGQICRRSSRHCDVPRGSDGVPNSHILRHPSLLSFPTHDVLERPNLREQTIPNATGRSSITDSTLSSTS
uniref:Uncharacterized protein n=1 Tax=Compsopogon caeruleus TaxID=31354 RepID=A0A7S1TJ27_9RHOD